MPNSSSSICEREAGAVVLGRRRGPWVLSVLRGPAYELIALGDQLVRSSEAAMPVVALEHIISLDGALLE